MVENGFGRLKANWKWLLNRLHADVEKITAIITTCFILYSICEIHGELFADNWMESVISVDKLPSQFTDLDDDVTVCDAQAIRNALVKYLSN